MPEAAPIAKADAVEALGATVHMVGRPSTMRRGGTGARGIEAGMAFIHPFDDPDVICRAGRRRARAAAPGAGHGPRRGAGRRRRADQRRSRSRSSPSVPRSRSSGSRPRPARRSPPRCGPGQPVAVDSARTIADGIAVKRPGELTLKLIDEWVDGAAGGQRGRDRRGDGVPARAHQARGRGRRRGRRRGAAGGQASGARSTARPCWCSRAATSGPGCWPRSRAATRRSTAAGWCCRSGSRIFPGAWRRCCGLVGRSGANLLDVQHIREGLDLHIQETAVQLVLETRGPEHAAAVSAAIGGGTGGRVYDERGAARLL